MDWSTANALGNKYEPEGLSLVKDPNGHERILLYDDVWIFRKQYQATLRHRSESFDVGGTYSGNNIDWMIRHNNSNGDVSIATARPDGNIGCETKDSTWSTGWTSFAGYFVGSEPHLMIQETWTAKIHPLDWEANLESATKTPLGLKDGVIRTPGNTEATPIFCITKVAQHLVMKVAELTLVEIRTAAPSVVITLGDWMGPAHRDDVKWTFYLFRQPAPIKFASRR